MYNGVGGVGGYSRSVSQPETTIATASSWGHSVSINANQYSHSKMPLRGNDKGEKIKSSDNVSIAADAAAG